MKCCSLIVSNEEASSLCDDESSLLCVELHAHQLGDAADPHGISTSANVQQLWRVQVDELIGSLGHRLAGLGSVACGTYRKLRPTLGGRSIRVESMRPGDGWYDPLR